ncbi:hypothetical protein BDV38DRAFT_242941 [Aspergillus pseudotamarii]|uniref:Uncharacterized protein n=1 Tax=Aspergillus pseudotamarii TaxID=132259 RepID=A0A5N6SWW8_ASPPS|nr:uncharacterized protein BDV38DRAFT_242941 [Aspergillus pseudotamarii]KAE8139178.1 hypothetical protein BDV38DRAFT_242941 [Aspergillus pseudotamarii]
MMTSRTTRATAMLASRTASMLTARTTGATSMLTTRATRTAMATRTARTSSLVTTRATLRALVMFVVTEETHYVCLWVCVYDFDRLERKNEEDGSERWLSTFQYGGAN